jgi:hypothetical protein
MNAYGIHHGDRQLLNPEDSERMNEYLNLSPFPKLG